MGGNGGPEKFSELSWNISRAYERQFTVASENRWNISIELEQEAWEYVKELITIDVNPPKQYYLTYEAKYFTFSSAFQFLDG